MKTLVGNIQVMMMIVYMVLTMKSHTQLINMEITFVKKINLGRNVYAEQCY